MNNIPLQTILSHSDGYCSKRTIASFPEPQTVESCQILFQGILCQDTLCCHDVKQLNQCFQKLKGLTQATPEVVATPLNNALESVNERIQTLRKAVLGDSKESSRHDSQKILKSSRDSASSFISLYHLNKFSELQKEIEAVFKELIEQWKKDEESLQDIAGALPCCNSLSDFENDINALIPPPLTAELKDLLDKKKNAFRKFETRKNEAVAKVKELQVIRSQSPKQYPPYLDELLRNGYLELYDHLLRMDSSVINKDTSKIECIKKQPLSQNAQIILQVREAIIQKVVSELSAVSEHVLFLLGGTKSGKSTTLCAFRGDEMEERDKSYISNTDKEGLIGHESTNSCTFLPTVIQRWDHAIIDFPGFEDTHGPLINIGMELALRHLINLLHPKILVLVSINDTEKKMDAIRKLQRRLERIVSNTKSCLLGLTKYSQFSDMIEKNQITKEEKRTNQLIAQLRAPEDQDERKAEEQKLGELSKKKEECEDRIKKVEEKIKEQCKLGRIVRLDKLHDRAHIEGVTRELFTLPNDYQVIAKDNATLDPEDKSLLAELFRDDFKNVQQPELVKIIHGKQFKKSARAFEEAVLNTSLTATLYASSHPEIALLAQLPELDPELITEHDQQICVTVMKNYLEAVAKVVDTRAIRDKLNSSITEGTSFQVKKLQTKLDDLENYIKRLKGEQPVVCSSSSDSPEIDQTASGGWLQLRETDVNLFKEIADVAIPGFIDTFLKAAPSYLGGVINGLGITAYSVRRQNIHKSFDSLISEVEVIHKSLEKLKELEHLLQKKLGIQRALDSFQIPKSSTTQHDEELVTQRIEKVREAYDAKKWDKEVTSLAQHFQYWLGERLLFNDDYHLQAIYSLILGHKTRDELRGIPLVHGLKVLAGASLPYLGSRFILWTLSKLNPSSRWFSMNSTISYSIGFIGFIATAIITHSCDQKRDFWLYDDTIQVKNYQLYMAAAVFRKLKESSIQ